MLSESTRAASAVPPAAGDSWALLRRTAGTHREMKRYQLATAGSNAWSGFLYDDVLPLVMDVQSTPI